MSAYDHHWQALRLVILDRDGHTCQLRLAGCTTVATHADHIVPISEGGKRLDPDNVRASCEHCNLKRNTQRQAELAQHALRTPTSATASRAW